MFSHSTSHFDISAKCINNQCFFARPPGIAYVQRRRGCCLDQVFAITKSFSWQNSMNFSPRSFTAPRPKGPTMLSTWPHPTLAFKSPINTFSFCDLHILMLFEHHYRTQWAVLQCCLRSVHTFGWCSKSFSFLGASLEELDLILGNAFVWLCYWFLENYPNALFMFGSTRPAYKVFFLREPSISRLSHLGKAENLYLESPISWRTFSSFPFWHNVLTFHDAIFNLLFVESFAWGSASWNVSLVGIIIGTHQLHFWHS